MNTTAIPTRAQYETREAAIFREQLGNCTLQGAKEFGELMATNPALIAERIGWILSGCYGWGACHAAHSNRVRAAWHQLTSDQQNTLDWEVSKVMDKALEEVKLNGRPA